MLKKILAMGGIVLGIMFFALALTSGGTSFTGAFIGSVSQGGSIIFYVFGFLFMLAGGLLVSSKKNLEQRTDSAIVVPTGRPDEKRAESAYKYFKENPNYRILVSGADKKPSESEEGKERQKRIRNSHNYRIYKNLREHSFDEYEDSGDERKIVKPKDMLLEKESGDTFENLYESINEAKERGWKSIYIATGDEQWKRFKSCYDRLVELDEVDPEKGPEIHHISSNESFWDKVYGFAGNVFYSGYKLRGDSIEEIKSRQFPSFLKKPFGMIRKAVSSLNN